MSSITIITIVVVALLTIVVFALVWLAYMSCLKMYKGEVDAGKHDETIHERYHVKKKRKAQDIIGGIASYMVLAALAALFITGIVYKARGENLMLGNQTALVIKSGSMSGFYDDSLEEEYRTYDYNASLQFGVGDICFFDAVPVDEELVRGEVYGYKWKNYIITHRLVAEYEGGLYEFRGDNNPTSDGLLIKKENVMYHYTGGKIPGVGAFILYAQSPFGIWSISEAIGLAVGFEVISWKVSKLEKARYAEFASESSGGGDEHEA